MVVTAETRFMPGGRRGAPLTTEPAAGREWVAGLRPGRCSVEGFIGHRDWSENTIHFRNL